MMSGWKLYVIIGVTWMAFSSGMIYAEMPRDMLVEAYTSYIAGEKADTIASRKEHFNQALNAYTKLDSIYNPAYGNGKLYFNIANSFFQVEEYPWAVLYYNRALKLMPREDKVRKNLEITLEKLSITNSTADSSGKIFDFFQGYFSLPERLQGFFDFSIILLALLAAHIMRPHKYIKRMIYLVGFCWLFLLISVGYTRYLAPIEGVLVRSTTLNRDAGEQFAKVSDQPTLAGNKVQVLEVLQDGQWLKILTPTGELGYVPNSAIRII